MGNKLLTKEKLWSPLTKDKVSIYKRRIIKKNYKEELLGNAKV